MRKFLKKTLSIVLAILLVFSAGAFAFAADTTDDVSTISKSDAEEIALRYLTFKNQTSIVYEDVYEYAPAYKVISTVVLNNNKVITFVCYVSKDEGDVLYRTGNYVGLDINPFNPLTQEEALNYAIAAFGADKENVVVLTKETLINDEGERVYHFLFCEDVFERNECTVTADSGYIDNIKITKPTNIIDRLVLMIRVLIARFDLFSFIR